MPSAAPLSDVAQRRRTKVVSALAGMVLLAITLWRIGLGFFDATELSTDEAQYWLWGQEWAMGAYSKPPLIGWVIGGVTAILGDQVWTVRVVAPLFHAATALVLLGLGRAGWGEKIGAIAAILYLLTPAVALGSAVMTTDTPLMLFAALALLIQFHLANSVKPRPVHLGRAVLLGGVIGLGFLAKYAMIYAVLGLGLAAVLSPQWRIKWREAGIAAATAILALTPHGIWLAAHGFITFDHMGQQSGLGAEGGIWMPHLGELGLFWANQTLVIGPFVFAAVVWGARKGKGPGHRGLWALMAAPLLIVSVQAVTGTALANWGVLWILPGVLVAASVLSRHPRWLRFAIGFGLCVSLALPVVKSVGTTWALPSGQLALARYLGQKAFADKVLSIRRASGAEVLVAQDRDFLAALSWAVRDVDGVSVQAWPGPDGIRHHWDLVYPYDPISKSPLALLILSAETPVDCQKPPLAEMTLGPGFGQGVTVHLYLLPLAECLPQNGDAR